MSCGVSHVSKGFSSQKRFGCGFCASTPLEYLKKITKKRTTGENWVKRFLDLRGLGENLGFEAMR